ncbi:MAG TPA: DUF4832 domain-containing protein [Bacteroidales bacterium]|nr:DUF4832 domain-containing protein [Bacteroidales bacterium]HCU21101.1 DUF4832 domain-containing protein [Bacteroidales bacterium]
MRFYRYCMIMIFGLSLIGVINAQKVLTVRFDDSDEVLTNPGIGFMTFQRLNGDKTNEGVGWTEGLPVNYQEFKGSLITPDHPMTSIAYFRVYWKYMEPEMGKYNWEMIDRVLKTAHERQQTLLLRIAPYGSGTKSNDPTDVPPWFRKMVGDRQEWIPEGSGWRIDAEDLRYAQYFGKMITELGKRYDGHPDVEAIDLSIIGFWGEGRGSEILKPETREALVSAYTDNFRKTPLIMLLTDPKTNKFGLSQADVGWRVDCIGDLGFWADDKDRPGWTHMYDYYPQEIINCGMKDAWKKAPVSLEVCGTIKSWKGKRDSCQYCQGYTVEQLKYIIDETLKWHISSFNAKSSGVPDEWRPYIDNWLKKMGYRFVLRSFSYPEYAVRGEKVMVKSWWDNRGVAPIYREYLLALKLTSDKASEVIITDADIKSWFPGDNLFDDGIFIPRDMPAGSYDLQIAIVDRQSHQPKVKLAITGINPEGWYPLGKIDIR